MNVVSGETLKGGLPEKPAGFIINILLFDCDGVHCLRVEDVHDLALEVQELWHAGC